MMDNSSADYLPTTESAKSKTRYKKRLGTSGSNITKISSSMNIKTINFSDNYNQSSVQNIH